MTLPRATALRFVLLLFLLALLIFVPLSAASAAAPQIQKQPLDFTVTVPAGVGCSFDVVLHGQGFVQFMLSFDKAGNLVVTVIHVHLHDTFSNPANGKSVPAVVASTEKISSSGTDAILGLIGRVTVPHHGLVTADVGRLVFDSNGNVIFEAGRHDNGPYPFICPYLA
jgi:hypothetical protein